MDEAGVDMSNFAKVEEWIRKRESRLRDRGGVAGTGKGPDAMVYGMSATEAAGAAPPGNAATAPESPEKDPWAGSAADPWAGAAQQPQTQAAPQPPPDAWDLDAWQRQR